MADRYQDRHFPADTASKADSDPLAELARLIGQTDPFGSANKPPPRPLQSRANARPQQYEPQAADEDAP
ncbi:SPOR domain-containing protein, partial [Bradyrhizobium sp. Cham227]|nr:SPOR domain-containing protein [Bradyrhizobium brasilense]